MKKIIIILSIIFFIFCSDSPEIKKEKGDRVVLAEFFTFARCAYCPYAKDALDSLSKEYGDSLAVIAYHRRVLGDTLSPAYVVVRESLYSIQTAPIVVFDGRHKVQVEKPGDYYPIYKNWVDRQSCDTTILRLKIETTIQGSAVSIKTILVPLDTIKQDTYRLFLVLTEDSVYFKQAGAPDSIFYFVMRKMIPDENGIALNFAYPDSLIKETNFILQPGWNTNKLGIVGFVQDMRTKEVIQAVIDKRIKK